MKLFVGLGNPGRQYAANRHNIGFMAVDALADEFRFPPFAKKFKGELSEGTIDGKKILLLKPQTFMNLSGESVGECARFYKIDPQEIAVFHDELDIPFGHIRVKQGGGSGGHNGIKSLDQHLGSDYWRVRLGIGHPGHKDLVSPYVLSNFAKEEIDLVATLLNRVIDDVEMLVAGDAAAYGRKLAAAPVSG